MIGLIWSMTGWWMRTKILLDQMMLKQTFNPKKQVGLFADPGIPVIADSALTADDKATIREI